MKNPEARQLQIDCMGEVHLEHIDVYKRQIQGRYIFDRHTVRVMNVDMEYL